MTEASSGIWIDAQWLTMFRGASTLRSLETVAEVSVGKGHLGRPPQKNGQMICYLAACVS